MHAKKTQTHSHPIRPFRLLNRRLDALERNMQEQSATERQATLTRALPELTAHGTALEILFTHLGPRADIVTPNRRVQRFLGSNYYYLFNTGREGTDHPMARLGMALRMYQGLGGTLNIEQQDYLTNISRVAMFGQAIGAATP